ncbi:hypothetical protein JOM56_000867, partial [Amanita muscaria]
MNLVASTLLLVVAGEEGASRCNCGADSPGRLLFAFSALFSGRPLVLLDYVRDTKLYCHLNELDVDLAAICFSWFLSLLTDCLSVETLFRVAFLHHILQFLKDTLATSGSIISHCYHLSFCHASLGTVCMFPMTCRVAPTAILFALCTNIGLGYEQGEGLVLFYSGGVYSLMPHLRNLCTKLYLV